MTSTSTRPVLLVLGVGPGLGLSVAHRFGAEGYAVALVSRSSERHSQYLQSLAGVEAAAFTGDVTDPASLRAAVDAARERFGRIDVGYFGPAPYSGLPGDLTGLDVAAARAALESMVLPAVDAASLLLPELRERGSGGLLFAGGLSSVVPMPALGAFVLVAAALRNYALTLHAALEPEGVYAGTLTIGGLIERGDLHRALAGQSGLPTLDPDDLARTLWTLFAERKTAEAVVSGLG